MNCSSFVPNKNKSKYIGTCKKSNINLYSEDDCKDCDVLGCMRCGYRSNLRYCPNCGFCITCGV